MTNRNIPKAPAHCAGQARGSTLGAFLEER